MHARTCETHEIVSSCTPDGPFRFNCNSVTVWNAGTYYINLCGNCTSVFTFNFFVSLSLNRRIYVYTVDDFFPFRCEASQDNAFWSRGCWWSVSVRRKCRAEPLPVYEKLRSRSLKYPFSLSHFLRSPKLTFFDFVKNLLFFLVTKDPQSVCRRCMF